MKHKELVIVGPVVVIQTSGHERGYMFSYFASKPVGNVYSLSRCGCKMIQLAIYSYPNLFEGLSLQTSTYKSEGSS